MEATLDFQVNEKQCSQLLAGSASIPRSIWLNSSIGPGNDSVFFSQHADTPTVQSSPQTWMFLSGSPPTEKEDQSCNNTVELQQYHPVSSYSIDPQPAVSLQHDTLHLSWGLISILSRLRSGHSRTTYADRKFSREERKPFGRCCLHNNGCQGPHLLALLSCLPCSGKPLAAQSSVFTAKLSIM